MCAPTTKLDFQGPPAPCLPCSTTCLLFQEERLLDQKEASSETDSLLPQLALFTLLFQKH